MKSKRNHLIGVIAVIFCLAVGCSQTNQSGDSFNSQTVSDNSQENGGAVEHVSDPAQATINDLVWHTSYEDAQQEARSTGKPILAEFTGSDWCPPCIRMKKNVFGTEEFKNWAKQNVVLLELDFPKSKVQSQAIRDQNQQLAEQFSIEGFPTIVFLSPSGVELGKMGFAPNVGQWLAAAQSQLQ